MRSLLAFTLIACTAFVATGLHAQHHDLSHVDVSCGECKEIVGVVYNISGNRIALNTTVDVLIDICKAKYANDTSKAAKCVDIVKLGGDLLPLVFKGLESLAWDIPITFCADIVKVCFEPCCEAGAPPQEIYINFNNPSSPYDIRVNWITLNLTAGAVVQWWQTSNPATIQSSAEETRTYTAGGWIGVIHTALMPALLPDTSYTYRVGSAVYGWSKNITFATLPDVIGVPSRPLRVLQIADMGYAQFSNDTVERMAQYVAEGKVDFIIHNGDIGYADADEQHWDLYFNKVQSFVSTTPYMTTPGNHELYWNFTAYQARLGMSMPKPVPATGSNAMYYTMTVGKFEFIFMNSETWIDTGDLDDMQMQWFQQYMATVNRTDRPIVTVTHHRPIYCEECGDILGDILRAQGEQPFYEQHVDLHLSGHWHNYQRYFPVYDNKLLSTNYTNPKAPVYIVNGAAGNREGQSGWHATKPYTAFGSTDYGMSYITYELDEVNRVATINYQFINTATGAVADSFVLTKDY